MSQNHTSPIKNKLEILNQKKHEMPRLQNVPKIQRKWAEIQDFMSYEENKIIPDILLISFVF